MNQWWMTGLFTGLVVLSASPSARADGFELGGRVGYGIPVGKIDDDDDLSEGIKGMIPLQLDAGYRIDRSISLGAYVMYGVGFLGDTISKSCDGVEIPELRSSCSVHDVRFGVQLHYHFAPADDLDPWLGVGLGYEWLTIGRERTAAGVTTKVSATGKGFEFINLQGGLDFKLARGFALGPFLSFSLGQYSSMSVSCSGTCGGVTSASSDIENKAMHQWLLLGVRGTFVIGDDAE